MANELIHASQGTTLTQAEFEAVGLHVCNSQATGDLIYASSAAQLSRLAIGATNKVLTVIGGVPTWQTTLAGLTLTSPVINGTITTTGLTLPAVTLGGNVSFNNRVHYFGQVSDTDKYASFSGGVVTSAGGGGLVNVFGKTQAAYPGAIRLYTPNAAGTGDIVRINISGMAASGSGMITLYDPLTLGGNMTVTGYAFDAGAGNTNWLTTGSLGGFILKGSNATHGAMLQFYHDHTTPELNYVIGDIQYYAYDGNGTPARQIWGIVRANYNNVTDGAEEISWQWLGMTGGVTNNQAMTLSGAGGLAVDLDNGGTDYYVALFDEYDDAQLLKQGIQQNNRELLADIGVLERKDTGSGYMMKIQPMVRLLAGGIYQTRQMLEDKISELKDRLTLTERKLALLEN